MRRILTIGMAVHSDIAGVWMVIEHIKEFFGELINDIEFLVLDNDPSSDQGLQVRDYIKDKFNRGSEPNAWRANYISAAPRKSTSLRNLLFHCADTEYVLCLDSHVLLKKGSLQKLIRFLKAGLAGDDLFQGPAYHEQGYVYGTHMNPAFRGGNFGTWGVMLGQNDQSNFNADMQPFEIPSHGMGLFLARRDTWLQFPISYRHFSGEEGYIQEKYRREGRKAYCLPFLGWIHRYGHIGGKISYPNTHIDKLRNHLIAFRELSLPLEIPLEYFRHLMTSVGDGRFLTGEPMAKTTELIANTLAEVQAMPMRIYPAVDKPFLGFPLRVNDHSGSDSEDYRQYEKVLPVHAS